jgi:hypothetical protein
MATITDILYQAYQMARRSGVKAGYSSPKLAAAPRAPITGPVRKPRAYKFEVHAVPPIVTEKELKFGHGCAISPRGGFSPANWLGSCEQRFPN